jgi:hypothetical protein
LSCRHASVAKAAGDIDASLFNSASYAALAAAAASAQASAQAALGDIQAIKSSPDYQLGSESFQNQADENHVINLDGIVVTHAGLLCCPLIRLLPVQAVLGKVCITPSRSANLFSRRAYWLQSLLSSRSSDF